MFYCAKKLLRAVADWVDGANDENSWILDQDHAVTPFGNSAFSAWQSWERFGTMPYDGGWLSQPLALLVQMKAIDLVVQTKRYMTQKNSDWSKLSKTQTEAIQWLNK